MPIDPKSLSLVNSPPSFVAASSATATAGANSNGNYLSTGTFQTGNASHNYVMYVALGVAALFVFLKFRK